MATISDNLASVTQQYNRDGYVMLRKFVHPGDVREILSEAKCVFAKQIDVNKCRNDYVVYGMVDLFQKNNTAFLNAGKTVQHLINLHRLSLLPRVVEMLRSVAGIKWPVICTRPVLYFNHPLLAKEKVYHTVDAHQDWRSMQGSSNAAVLWVPLEDCPVEKGALQVLPGSHRNGLRTTSVDSGFGMVSLTDAEQQQLVSLDCKAGDAVLFHSMLVHQSGINTTDSPRWSCHFRYNDLEDPQFIKRGYVHPYIYKPVEELL